MNFIQLFEDNIDFFQKEIDDFFEINKDDYEFFHPHSLTWGDLKNIIFTKSKDSYVLMVEDGEVAGYGLLRGWDEGYDIPSLGIMISRNYRGKGYSSILMNELHSIAKKVGSKKIRLTVFKENKKAISLYNKLGYEFSDKNEKELIGIKSLENV